MVPRRPYLLRAMHEWMLDSGCTPHLVVDANAAGVDAPDGYASDGKLVLNVSPAATQDLSLGNDRIVLKARFGGTPREVVVPIAAVLAIYARETGQGIVFSAEDEAGVSAPDAGIKQQDKPAPAAPGGRSHLKVIK